MMIDPADIAIGGDQKVRQQIQKLHQHQNWNWLVKRASRISWKDRRAIRHWRSSLRCQSIEMRR
jgi:hypothetical protein